jgi:hypothetical protein
LDQALLCVREDGDGLLLGDAGKPLEKLIDRGPSFQVFEQRLHRGARSAKNPRAAHFAFDALDFRTIAPIQHAYMICLARKSQQEVATR